MVCERLSRNGYKSFDEVLPPKDVCVFEARRFLAFKLIFAWKTRRRSDAGFEAPNIAEMKSVAELARCRSPVDYGYLGLICCIFAFFYNLRSPSSLSTHSLSRSPTPSPLTDPLSPHEF